MSILTPFETNGRLTALAEEQAFLDALAADSATTYASVGTSVQGKPLWKATVGTGPRNVLITAEQHSLEIASREGALTWLRDLTYSTDPAVTAYLAAHTVHIMPTCNPDKLDGADSNNANGVNLNRDHIALSQPETQAIAQQRRDLAPHLNGDLHEGIGTIETDTELQSPQGPQNDSGLAALSSALVDDVIAGLNGAGITSQRYIADSSGNPSVASEHGGLRHMASFLVETYRGGAATLAQRVGWQVAILNRVLAWHAANTDAVASAVAASRSNKIDEGAAHTAPFDLAPVTPGTVVLNPQPAGYSLTEAQHTATAVQRDLFGIVSREKVGGGYWIGMDQAAQPLIPYLLDPLGEYEVVQGSRSSTVPDLVPLPGAYTLRVGGVERTIASLRVGGVERAFTVRTP